MGLSSFKFVQWAPKDASFLHRFAFWPFNVDDFGTNPKRVYDFLLVGHCDYGPILHRLPDMATYWLKIAYFCYIFATPLSFGALAHYVPFAIFG